MRKMILALAFLSLPFPALAQTPEELVFKLTAAEAGIIVQALGEMKLKDAVGVYSKLVTQANEQSKPKEPPKE